MSTTPPHDSDDWQHPEERRDYRNISPTPTATPRSERRIYPHATPGKRLVAVIIDGIIVSIIGMFVQVGGAVFELGLWSAVLAWLFQVGYFVYYWASTGATPGKSMLNLRVVDKDYQIINEGRAILRYLGYMVSSLCFMLGYIWILFDGAGQGWHDKIAGTYVVDTSVGNKKEE